MVEGEAWETIGAGVDEAAGGAWRSEPERASLFPAAFEQVIDLPPGRVVGVTQGTVMMLLVTGQ